MNFFKLKKILSCLLFVFSSFGYSAWYEQADSKTFSFVSFYDKNKKKIYLKSDTGKNYIYQVSLFTSINKKISSIAQIKDANFLTSKTKINKFIYQFEPKYNGKYYFYAFLLTKVSSKKQEYSLYRFKNSLDVKNLSQNYSLREMLPEEKIMVSAEEKKNKTKSQESQRSGANNPTVDLSKSSKGNAKLSGYSAGTGTSLEKVDLDQINSLLKNLRELNLEMRVEYFLKNNFDAMDIFRFFIRYSEVSTKVDNMYYSTLLNRANWEYIEKINKEYANLSKTFKDISKKILAYLEEEKKTKKKVKYNLK